MAIEGSVREVRSCERRRCDGCGRGRCGWHGRASAKEKGDCDGDGEATVLMAKILSVSCFLF